MGRAGIEGDELGSAIIGSRLVRDTMRLCFFMEKRYAPYQKWFGIAFSKLNAATELKPILHQVLVASNWEERQKHLVEAYEILVCLHNSLDITQPMATKATQFHERPFLVISKGVFSKAIRAKITDPAVQEIARKPLIGSIDLFSDSTDLLSDKCWRDTLRGLYNDGA